MNSLDVAIEPLTCFKYRSGEAALRCLEEGSLYFARPDSLNDTLEAKFDYAEPEEFQRVFGQTMSEISQRRGGSALFYDPDVLPEMSQANATENQRLRTFCDGMGVFSAARRPDHQAMWAYYAENGRGVCFELAWTHELMDKYQLWPVDVLYSGQPRLHNRAHDWRKAFLELAEEHPGATLDELRQLSLEENARRKWGIATAARAVSTKHTDWAHENEVRLLAPKFGAIPLLAEVLKCVHYVRTDGGEWGPIMQQLYTNYPAVEHVYWQFSHGALNATATPMEFRLIPV
ncbi:DUF2971 domain-containing protein [Candidimonas sp. SYP-B2681]|uniref:DUF2971 domain-containing protein n=1 Tax=Candidimonas sp. SYP-B2681 TaxID=2497686 RepID=UPI000F882625|nr:DUF2971 domain-containing protein [Candidimonas sp. SYP-B2681]RTZ39782.1 DUF2971 domain-containing protein [Candidimonas sp. SYP-B2681]